LLAGNVARESGNIPSKIGWHGAEF